MTQYDTLNVKLSDSQVNKLKLGIQNDIEVTLKISSNVVGDSNDESYFPYKFLLINTQVSKLCKAFGNGSSANIKLSKTQLHQIGQLGLLGPLLKTRLPLIGKVLKPLAKSVLIPLGLTAPASATGVAIHRKIFGSDVTTLIITNEEMNDSMKLIKSFEESSLLIKGVGKSIKNEAKEQNGRFLRMLLGTLGASFFRKYVIKQRSN